MKKFEISTFSPAGRNFSIFSQAELETKSQILLKLYTGLHCDDIKLRCPFFDKAIHLLAKTKRINSKFRPSSLVEEILAFFWQTELETKAEILLKLYTPLHCHDRKLSCPVFDQAIHLIGKTNQRNFKFLLSRLLEEILSFFGRLNWKQGVKFCWNFLQLFTVMRGN